jgi:hypothetical protein
MSECFANYFKRLEELYQVAPTTSRDNDSITLSRLKQAENDLKLISALSEEIDKIVQI